MPCSRPKDREAEVGSLKGYWIGSVEPKEGEGGSDAAIETKGEIWCLLGHRPAVVRRRLSGCFLGLSRSQQS